MQGEVVCSHPCGSSVTVVQAGLPFLCDKSRTLVVLVDGVSRKCLSVQFPVTIWSVLLQSPGTALQDGSPAEEHASFTLTCSADRC